MKFRISDVVEIEAGAAGTNAGAMSVYALVPRTFTERI